MSWGLGGSDSMFVLGVEGSEKKCAPPRIISGTALTSASVQPHTATCPFDSLTTGSHHYPCPAGPHQALPDTSSATRGCLPCRTESRRFRWQLCHDLVINIIHDKGGDVTRNYGIHILSKPFKPFSIVGSVTISRTGRSMAKSMS